MKGFCILLLAFAASFAGLRFTATAAAPTVGIRGPGEGTKFTAPASFTIFAFAADDGGSPPKVEFFANGLSLGPPVDVPPYIFSVKELSEGNYAIHAVATDDEGLLATSQTNHIIVAPSNRPPAIQITSPTNGAVFTASSRVVFEASVSDPDASIPFVTVNISSAQFGTRTLIKASPYRLDFQELPAGKYALVAWAFDEKFRTEAPPLNFTVVDPPVLSTSKILPDGRFQFTIKGTAGLEHAIETATELEGPWSKVQTVLLTSPQETFTADQSSSVETQFFRVVYSP